MLKIMDNMELAIETIKSIRNIHFYHIFENDRSIPAVMVYYNKDKILNLCALDKYYDKLLKKAREVYAAEKGSCFTIIDRESKKILDATFEYDATTYEQISDHYSKRDEALYNHNGYMREIVLPVTKYVIEQIYGLSEQKIMWSPVINDWFGTGEMSAMIGNDKQIFPYRITCEKEGLYRVEIANVVMSKNKLELSIYYKKSGLEINLKGDLYKVEGFINYICDGEMRCSSRIMLDEKVVYSCSDKQKVMAVDETIESKLPDFIKNLSGGFAYRLPWGQIMAYECEQHEEDGVNTVDRTVAFISSTAVSEHVYALSYRDIITQVKVGYTIYKFALDMYRSNENEKQLHFCDMGYSCVGRYKETLAGKYYMDKAE